jgi:hypothetical protein
MLSHWLPVHEINCGGLYFDADLLGRCGRGGDFDLAAVFGDSIYSLTPARSMQQTAATVWRE